MRRLVPLAFVLLSACASLALYEQQVSDTLYFGTQRPGGGVVSEAEWQQFVAEEVTPRFSGFTVWEARGTWKGESEATHVVQIVHPHGHEAELRAIIDAYKKRFAQEAVFQVREEVWLPR
jgi:hypothetical protein